MAALGLLVAGLTVWAMCALYYCRYSERHAQDLLAGLFGLATACGFAFLPNRRRTLACFLAAFALWAWWTRIQPSNSRDWQQDVAVLPWATIQGPLVTLHNIRNFTYRTETDCTPGLL